MPSHDILGLVIRLVVVSSPIHACMIITCMIFDSLSDARDCVGRRCVTLATVFDRVSSSAGDRIRNRVRFLGLLNLFIVRVTTE